MIHIKTTDTETREDLELDTDGFLLLYLDKENIKMHGKLGLKVITPILTRIALEKLIK